jgi:Pyruvate/2-oxoacid:ferredoxin oxidoreductase delta subunit
VEIEFEGGIKAGVAKECLEADLLINIPKLKTHFEMGMSVCLKNLMGCLVGQENKKKTHQSLALNILNLNNKIKPHLHIVDAIISMEGLGPTRGMPIQTNTVFIGTDPYLLDMMCAKLASFDYKKVKTLDAAERRGLIDQRYLDFVDTFYIKKIFEFKPPKPGLIAGFIHNPIRQKYFLAIRNTGLFNYLCSTKLGGKILFKIGLRQDVFLDEEMKFVRLSLNKERCLKCNKCVTYCPVAINLPDQLEEERNRCIECLYCFMTCPEKAIDFEGHLGFINEQIRQYDSMIRKFI